jgi:predicted DNA-binding transcriptional regulator AlpA
VIALVGDPIPLVCSSSDVCRLVRISRSQYYLLKKQGRFPIPEIEPRIGDSRYYGEDVRRYLAGEFADTHNVWRRRRKGL